MILARSLLFQFLFYVSTTLYLVLLLPLLPLLPRRWLWRLGGTLWSHTTVFLLRWVVGMRMEIVGRENIPTGPLLVAAKHQSAWETIALLTLFDDPAFILKRELMWIPLFGWYALKTRMIPINRGARVVALKEMTDRAQAEIADDRQILIFPEGTRRPVGAPPEYKFGVAHLYASLGVPCLPIALNSGLYWPRHKPLRAGIVRVEILPTIPAGLPRGVFMARVQREIETATARLVTQGYTELGEPEPAQTEAPPRRRKLSPESTPVEKS